MSLSELRGALSDAFQQPTLKQKESYGRFAHTLAAASVIGMVTIIFTERGVTGDLIWRIIGLAASGVTCFAGGAIIGKGE